MPDGRTEEQWKKDYVDSITNKTIKETLFDTAGISEAPVKVTKARFFQEEYSNYKSVSLTFKNVSDKKIDGIKFRWYGENAFREPADMGGLQEGFGGGFTDRTIRPGQSMTLQWNILSRDGKTIQAWPIEVALVTAQNGNPNNKTPRSSGMVPG